MRPLQAGEEEHWEALMWEHQYLGYRSLVGETLRYVGESVRDSPADLEVILGTWREAPEATTARYARPVSRMSGGGQAP